MPARNIPRPARTRRSFVAAIPWFVACVVAIAGCSGTSYTVQRPVLPEDALGEEGEVDYLEDDAALCELIDETLDYTGRRHLNSRDHAAWQVFHGVLAFGEDLRLEHRGQAVSALRYLLDGGDLNGWKLAPGEKGLECILESGSKTGMGHEDQWLGYMAFHNIPPDQPILLEIQGVTHRYTMMDLVTQAQWDLHTGMEATWTLMGLSTYLPLNATWSSKNGESWDMEKLIEMEASADINESACGGTHRLSALTIALNRYKHEHSLTDDQLQGAYAKARDVIRECAKKAHDWQQPDGSLSSEYFIRPATTPDAAKRLGTTGHTLEFLTLALTREKLEEPWVKRAVIHLCDVFDQTRDLPLECGGLYHAARGLQNFRYVVFGPRERLVEPQPTEPDGGEDEKNADAAVDLPGDDDAPGE